MIELQITKTAKSFSPKSFFSIYHEETKRFKDISKAKSWLKEEYGKSKRQFMYIDDKNGKSLRVGYIIGFREYEWNSYTGKKDNFIEQHWITFYNKEVLII